MIDMTSRTRTNPRDCGDRWNCAHTAKREARTALSPAKGRGKVERRKRKIARNVRPPDRKGYTWRKGMGAAAPTSIKMASRRNVPGQFAEYSPRAPAGRWPVAWISRPSLRWRYESQYLAFDSKSPGVPARMERKSIPVATIRISDRSRSASTIAKPMSPIPTQYVGGRSWKSPNCADNGMSTICLERAATATCTTPATA